jgi:hypothetical protein
MSAETPEQATGLQAWHRAPCAWCDDRAKGTALFAAPGHPARFGSCGKHGERFEAFETPEQAPRPMLYQPPRVSPSRAQAWAAKLAPAVTYLNDDGRYGPDPVDLAPAWAKQVGDPGIKPGDVVIFEPAGRHWRLIAEAAPTPREHWMKRLFQRGK